MPNNKAVMAKLSNKVQWNQAGLFQLSKLKWVNGKGSFEGGKIAVVAKNPKTGAMAFYLKMSKKALKDAHEGRLHSHKGTGHTIVLKGSVSAIIGGKKLTMKAGDYFRLPEGVLHQGSIIPGPDPTIMFMITEGNFDLVYAPEGKKAPVLRSSLAQKAVNRTALYSLNKLDWKKGTSSFDGGKVAVVSQDRKQNTNVLYLKMPPKKYEDAHKGRTHSHSALAHTILLKGTVKAKVNGVELTMKPGDYFRAPAGFEHKGSHVTGPEPAVMVMITEGKFGVN